MLVHLAEFMHEYGSLENVSMSIYEMKHKMMKIFAKHTNNHPSTRLQQLALRYVETNYIRRVLRKALPSGTFVSEDGPVSVLDESLDKKYGYFKGESPVAHAALVAVSDPSYVNQLVDIKFMNGMSLERNSVRFMVRAGMDVMLADESLPSRVIAVFQVPGLPIEVEANDDIDLFIEALPVLPRLYAVIKGYTIPPADQAGHLIDGISPFWIRRLQLNEPIAVVSASRIIDRTQTLFSTPTTTLWAKEFHS